MALLSEDEVPGPLEAGEAAPTSCQPEPAPGSQNRVPRQIDAEANRVLLEGDINGHPEHHARIAI